MNLRKRANPKNLIDSIKSLFVTQKQLSPRKRLPDAYFGQIALTKTVYQANEWLAKANGASRKEFANFLMTRGISSFLGENIELYIRETTSGNQSSLPVKVKRTVAVARRMSKEQGYNIDAIIPPR